MPAAQGGQKCPVHIASGRSKRRKFFMHFLHQLIFIFVSLFLQKRWWPFLKLNVAIQWANITNIGEHWDQNWDIWEHRRTLKNSEWHIKSRFNLHKRRMQAGIAQHQSLTKNLITWQHRAGHCPITDMPHISPTGAKASGHTVEGCGREVGSRAGRRE